jgi:short-subunit dehydrogenase
MARAAPPTRPLALVTGASSGIGAALAARFARGGHDVVLVARGAERLREQARTLERGHAVRTWAVPLDLAAPDGHEALVRRIGRLRRPLDVLVNCAGVLEQGPFVDIAPSRHAAMVDLNAGATVGLIARFAPGMVARGRGRILNVASIASFQPIPLLATYAATKAFVLSLSESLSEELAGTGVTVTALCPGITATGMLDGVVGANPRLAGLPAVLIGTADEVADEGYDACLRGEAVRVAGGLNRAATAAARAAPRWLVRRVGGAVARSLR